MDTDTVATTIAYAGAGIALAGLLFVVGVGSQVAGPPPEFSNRITAVEDSPSEAPAGDGGTPEGVLRYANLSERGQTVFDRTRRAYERNGSDYVLDPEATPPPEFYYPTDTDGTWGHGRYYVVYEGQYYRLTTDYRQSGRGAGIYVLVLFYGVPLLGVGALVLGGYAVWRRIGG